jgi:DNA-binding CsgD family transcriptional regulator
LRQARRQNGSTIFLLGEDGIGKTRLAAYAADQARARGMAVLHGRASTLGPVVTLRPVIEICLQLRRSAGPEQTPDLPESPVLLAEAVLAGISAVSRQRGGLVVIEDLHLADPATLSIVEYMVDNVRRRPVALIVTAGRTPAEGRDLATAAASRGTGTVLELGPLGRAEVTLLLAHHLAVRPEDVPVRVINEVYRDSAGNPFLAEELLRGLRAERLVVAAPDGGWLRAVGQRRGLTDRLVSVVGRRVGRLGPRAERLFSAAAVLGDRFPLSVVREVTGLREPDLLTPLRGGITTGLVCADEPAPDWYRFRTPLVAEALRRRLIPADRAALARMAAEAVLTLHPGLPGEWCSMAATLLTGAGDRGGAARALVTAAAAALAAGAVESALAPLEHAWELAAEVPDPDLRADVLDVLLPALAWSGQVGRAARLADAVDELSGTSLATHRLAALHTGLALIALVAGRWSEGLAQVSMARAVLGGHPGEREVLPVDMIDLRLRTRLPDRGPALAVDDRAHRVALAAERLGLPEVACQAWDLLGRAGLERGSPAAAASFERAGTLARRHRVPLWSVHTLARQGHDDWLADGGLARLRLARNRAGRCGAHALVHLADTTIALQTVLCGEFRAAEQLIDQVWRAVTVLDLAEHARRVLMVRAVHAAHRASRGAMERALAELGRWGGEEAHIAPLTFGLARAFCALLEEDRDAARDHLARAATLDAEHPGIYPLAGGHGLSMLLNVLGGDVTGHRPGAAIDHPASRVRWNRHFALLATAVLLGRRGRPDDAAAAVEQAQQVGQPFPVARHLGLRLVAEAAALASWGDPVRWLRLAEDYFHGTPIPAVAGACRAMMRRAGVVVPRRRAERSGIPQPLRLLGVTLRENDVLELLAEGCGNRTIAGRLHISPRTVEKHVASLLIKIGQPDRMALGAYAVRIRPEADR